MVRKSSNYRPYKPQHGLRARGGFNVSIRMEGEWIKFGSLINNLNTDIAIAASGAQRSFANKYKVAVKRNITEGGKRFGYAPTSAKYVAHKANSGGGSTLLRWTDSFRDSVTIINKGMFQWLVGIPKGIIRRPTAEKKRKQVLQVHEYANILEHGDGNIPARPIFQDTLRDMGGLARFKQFVTASLIQRLRMRGVNPKR